jgi:uncharacterized protein (DUF302 family)
MIYKVQTQIPITQVKEELESRAKALGFGVLHQYDFKKILHDKGYPIEKDITVYELCNPPGAQHALTQFPEISAYLPCRISVYEDGDSTWLATIGLDDIVQAIDVDESFRSYMSILFANLKKVMESWNTTKEEK